MPTPVFISYSSDDTAISEKIRAGLESAQLRCWMAPRDIAPGLDYAEQIIHAIESCAVLVLILSEQANRSPYVRNEVERAMAKRKVVIPMRIQPVQPSRSLEFFISNAQWIDAWQPPLESQVEVLAAAIREHLHSPPSWPLDGAKPTSPVTFAAAPSPTHLPANRRSNLPTLSTPFVGREVELAEIVRQLADPACRLLTLAGHGGIGKTRLSLEVARSVLAEGISVPDGVFFVPLDTLTAPEQIPAAIAAALDLSLASQSDSRALLLTFLAEKQLLLVLDNFEHLLDGADLVADILAGAPAVKVLVTSREALNLQEEWFHPISGLDLPPEGGSLEAAQTSAAVQLFALCANRARSSFNLSAEIAHVVQLCRMVDGMPLALELAAAWLRSLTCAQIVQELQSNMQLLSTSMRNLPQRHRSMEAVFAQSWQLLDPPTRNNLCQLAVFEGGFDWAAAKAVSGVSMPTLMRLVDSSWLQVREEGRYDLVPLVRSYLLARLEADYASTAGEAPNRVRDRHSLYYASAVSLRDSNALLREREVANLRVGWQHALLHFHGEGFIEFVTRLIEGFLGLISVWHGSYQEGDELMRATESQLRNEIASKEGTPFAREIQYLLAELLRLRAFDSNLAGLSQKAELQCRECLAILEQLGERDSEDWLYGGTLLNLAWALILQSRLQEADELLDQASALYSNKEPWKYRARTLNLRSFVTENQGRFVESKATARRALELLSAEKTVDFVDFHVRMRLGSVSYSMGEYEEAAQWLGKAAEMQHMAAIVSRLEHQILWARLDSAVGNLESARTRCLTVLSKARERSDRSAQIWALSELGRITLMYGTDDVAEAYFREALHVAEQIGRRKEVAKALVGLGNVALARATISDISEASAHFHHALTIAWPLGILPEAIAAVIGLAEVEIHAGNQQRAASWLRMAVEHAATPHHIRLHAAASLAALDEQKEIIAGSLDEIVAVAL